VLVHKYYWYASRVTCNPDIFIFAFDCLSDPIASIVIPQSKEIFHVPLDEEICWGGGRIAASASRNKEDALVQIFGG
jgi:hypothetical protein